MGYSLTFLLSGSIAVASPVNKEEWKGEREDHLYIAMGWKKYRDSNKRISII